ncbi:hypothetical protein [Devosia sp.]|uniref:hypothetical protein n=1 Tax=Devosia sp. TaxID=1871048 RepID=UPI0032673B18
MRRIITAIAALCLLSAPAMAQAYTGNWGCKANGVKAGILTIYGNSYGFASAVFGDPASGTGELTPYTDGVGFNNGALMEKGSVVAGRIVTDANAVTALQLESATAIVMLCTPR